ncbi:palmitoyltransferase ZDHHC6 [Drosophila nasuta]|uniref:palmitoyltransferase ZDHHC6 n=1 Tax=Drosophila nasuta TaxID=42062 RepID=UPI00295E5C45|nr:palmitoyltransferase ZDHHC6 [Drosophila nasuta]
MDEEANELKRFLHWGPILTIGNTLIIGLTTLSWWPKDFSFTTQAHLGMFMLVNVLAAYNFVMAIMVGPGFLPKQWRPQNSRDSKYLQYCRKCDGLKAPRSHHCRRCNRCVKKMDHHCPWINHCVGWSNQAYFVYFVFFYMLSNLHAAVVLALSGSSYFIEHSIRRRRSGNIFGLSMCLICFSLALGMVLCMVKLLVVQLRIILGNKTSIEQWIVEKANNRRCCKQHKLEPFVYPYNLGWYFNLGQVFNIESQTRSQGIEWPVRKGCDQYTLTKEQMAQKKEKLERSRIYRCIRRSTGYWFPIFSQGLMATVCVPCADDPRICVELNDLIRVTRIQDYWLFGELVRFERGEPHDMHRRCTRGWFPSRCAIDVTEQMDAKELSELKNSQSKIKQKLNQD